MASYTGNERDLVLDLNPLAKIYVPPAQAKADPGVFETVGAAFKTHNLIASALMHERVDYRTPYDASFDPFEPEDPGRPFHPNDNPFKLINGYEDFVGNFIGARNSDDVDRIKANIDRELENRRILGSASGWVSIPSSLAAGVLDPLIFVPGAAAVKTVRGVSAVRTMVKIGAIGGGLAAAQEFGLQATQETRPGEETAIAVAGGAFLSGLLGLGIGRVTAARWARASREVEAAMARVGEPVLEAAPPPAVASLAPEVERQVGQVAGRNVIDVTPATTPRKSAAEVKADMLRQAQELEAAAKRRREFDAQVGEDPARVFIGRPSTEDTARAQALAEQALDYQAPRPATPEAVIGSADYQTMLRNLKAENDAILLAEAGYGARQADEAAQAASRALEADEARVNAAAGRQRIQEPDPAVPGGLTPAEAARLRRAAEGSPRAADEPTVARSAGSEAAGASSRVFSQIDHDRLIAQLQAENARIDAELKGSWSPPAPPPFGPSAADVARVGQASGRQVIQTPGMAPGGEVVLGANRLFDPELWAEGVSTILKGGKWTMQATAAAGRWLVNQGHAAVASIAEAARNLVRRFGDAVKPYIGHVWAYLKRLYADETGTFDPARFGSGKPARPWRSPDSLEAEAARLRRQAEGFGSADPLAPGSIKFGPEVSSTTTARQVGKMVAGGKVARWFLDLSKWINPRLQMFMSRSAETQRAADRLVQSAVALTGTKGLDVETLVKLHMNRASVTLSSVDDLFVQYLRDDPNAVASFTDKVLGSRGRPDKLTREEFDVEISKAMRAGDVHHIPQVQEAARRQRELIIKPLRDEAIRLGFLPAEVAEETGYLTRLYNADKLRIPAERKAFVDTIVDWGLESGATGKSGKALSIDELRVQAEQIVDQIVQLPDGRNMPGDALVRGPLRERTLDIPDEKIERWLVNDNERIMRYYVRSMASDLELAKMFGMVNARPQLEAIADDVVGQIRSAQDKRGLTKILREAEEPVSRAYKSKKLAAAFAAGRKTAVRRILSAGTDAEAADVLKARYDAIIRRFSGGDMKLALDQIETAYAKRIAAASKTDGKLAARLTKERNRDLTNLKLARDDIRGLAALGEDPTALTPRIFRAARQLTYNAVGGLIGLSSIPDLGTLILNHGVDDVFRFAVYPMLNDIRGAKLGADEARLALGVSEIFTNARAMRLADIDEQFRPRTVFEKGLDKVTHLNSIANLSAPWNAKMTTMIALVTQGSIIRNALEVAAGRALEPGIVARMQELGIDDAMLKRIAAQFEKHAHKADGERRLFVPNTPAWDDLDAQTIFRAAVLRAKSLDLIHGGRLDQPNLQIPWLSQEMQKTIFQFMNYGMAANTRILARSLQYKDARILSGVLMGAGFGMLSVYLKAMATGRDLPENHQWVVAGVRASGISGLVFDLDRYIEQLSAGKVGIGVALGAPGGSRYYSPQSFASALFGPSASKALEALNLGVDIADFQIDEYDVRQLRRLMFANNNTFLARLFNAVEDQAVKAVR